MPFIDLNEPYIIDVSHDVAAVFKPAAGIQRFIQQATFR